MSKADPAQSSGPQYTARGFRIYADLKDYYGAEVTVIESSMAVFEGTDGPWVWIFSEGGRTNNDGAAHLSVEQAKVVRDALNVFIVENDRD